MAGVRPTINEEVTIRNCVLNKSGVDGGRGQVLSDKIASQKIRSDRFQSESDLPAVTIFDR